MRFLLYASNMSQTKLNQTVFVTYLIQLLSLALATFTALLSWMVFISTYAVSTNSLEQIQLDGVQYMQSASDNLTMLSLLFFLIGSIAAVVGFLKTKTSNKYAILTLTSTLIFSAFVVVTLLYMNAIFSRVIVGAL